MLHASRFVRLASTLGLCLAPVAFAACGGTDANSTFDKTADGGDTMGGDAGGNGSGGGFGGGGGGTGDDAGTTAESDECKKMDIVFVVDDSGSMKQEQDNLAANFPKFVDVINGYKTKSGAELDYRLAVTTTSSGKSQGAFSKTRGDGAPADCKPGVDRPWLERTDGAIADFFACRAQAGTDGSSVERPLESALLSVTARIDDGTNTASGASFVRSDALLAFVAITDEDEGGTENKPARAVGEYPALFDKVKGGERGKWAAAVIAGEKKCSSAGFGKAAEAARLKTFINDVGKNGVFASICTGDLTEGLTKALSTFDQACKDFPLSPK